MNYDDFDVDRTLKKEYKSSPALDLIKGLGCRRLGNNGKTKENLELFAEQEFVRKTSFSEMKCELPGLPRSSFLVVFSSDGSKIASTHGNHNIYVSDSKSGKNIKTLVGHPRTPWCIAFHPTSNQIVASGCLGGQVRIWDLSGGSEVWTTENQSVIASIAFHPNDRVLVIATYNEVYFWDWSKPEPFVQCSTNNPKEKVRYVAFDHLGHKLITGIANSPQTRWERVRAPVPVNSRICCTLPYRRRITPRLLNLQSLQSTSNTDNASQRESYSRIPEREMRITTCYRNLVREYEQLVQRYLQLYRPRQMIDRGTDPMEPTPSSTTSCTQTPVSTSNTTEPSTSNSVTNSQPSTSRSRCECQPEPSPSTSQNLISPSKIFSVLKNSPGLIRGTQTTESRKHKVEQESGEAGHEKRVKRQRPGVSTTESVSTNSNTQLSDMGTQTQSPRRLLVINTSTMRTPDPVPNFDQPSTSGYKAPTNNIVDQRPLDNISRGTSAASINTTSREVLDNNVDELLLNMRRTAEEEVRNRILPIIRSVPETDRPELIRLFENNRESYRMRFRQMCSSFTKKPKRWPRPPMNTSSENNSSSDDDTTTNRVPRHSPMPSSSQLPEQVPETQVESPTTSTGTTTTAPRNYNTELEQLVTTLLTEIENNDREINSLNQRQDGLRNAIVTTATTTQTSNIDSVNNRAGPSSVSFSNTTNTTSTNARLSPAFSLERTLFSRALPHGPPARSSNNTNNGNSSSSNSSQNFELLSLFESLERDTQSLRNSVSSNPSTPTTNTSSVTTSTTTVESTTTVTTTTTTASTMTTNTRTTNSPVYTSNSFRRFFSNRTSAFMPTRVNYTRTASRLRRSRRLLSRGLLSPNSRGPFALDELINYSERANSEDDPPVALSPLNPTVNPDTSPVSPENIGLGYMYSNIVQDLESSLHDVRNIRASRRPEETSDMLSNFSERLENIMNQSDTILRNLRSSMEMLSGSNEPGSTPTTSANEREREPTWSFYDPNFYVRDQRTDANLEIGANDLRNPIDNPNIRMFQAVASDHTYPRNPDNTQQPGGEQMSPLMTSLHITITHIQKQARLLRQQVESIERIDRAMLEVAQVQLIRQLVIELIKHMRVLNSESRNTGMSSVRQMMAGTRISDSSPYDSPAEEPSPPSTSQASTPTAESSSSARTQSPQPSTSLNVPPEAPSVPSQSRPRGSNRKTYPPCRLLRLQRNWRRPSLVRFLSRRYMEMDRERDMGSRQNGPRRSNASRMADIFFNPYRQESFPNYAIINSSTLSLMTRRLENLLTEQMRYFTRPATRPAHIPSTHGPGSIEFGEHILSLRLHGCVMRMDRVLASRSHPRSSLQSDPSATVTQDGFSRYGARHTLSLIIEGMIRHMEELGNSNFSQTLRLEIHGVLALSLLLSELLLLQVVDSIPPPTGMNLDPERESLTIRIDQMCFQMLHSRFSSHSNQLSRSLRLMRLTMRNAYRALGETYNARRNAMLPRQQTNRRQLIRSINGCIRTINQVSNLRRSNNSNDTSSNERSSSQETTRNTSGTNETNNFMNDWYSTISDYIGRYSDSNEVDGTNNAPSSGSGPRERDSFERPDNNSSNNSDDNDDESAWLGNNNNNPSPPTSSPYRSNIVPVNLPTSEASQPRTWNVPSVQVNDVPVSDPSSTYQQRIITQRQRFADRVSELRHNPSIGLLRPRFLHPLYASVNPFDADLDDPQREPAYESDMVTTVTPNHRLQAWDISDWSIPAISNSLKNVIVSECKIHNDASVDIAKDGTLLVTLLPSGGYLNVTNRLGVYSLRWETLGQCLYTTSFEQNAISVALSPLSRHLLVGLASRRVSIVSNDRWVMARIFKIEQKDVPGDRLPMVRELEQTRDSRINCIRWLPNSGQGIIYCTNAGQLIVLT